MRFLKIAVGGLSVILIGSAIAFITALVWYAWPLPTAGQLEDRYRASGSPVHLSEISPHLVAALAVDRLNLDLHVAEPECREHDSRGLERQIAAGFCLLAVKVLYTKEERQLYWLNSGYYGRNSYGVTQASLAYFGKIQSALSLPEAALLIAITRAPSRARTDIHGLFAPIAERLGISQNDREAAIAAVLPFE